MTAPPDKRRAILQATLELIADRGFHAAPMALVAERAGVAAGTIYRYFPSKESLINELYAEIKGEIFHHLQRGLPKTDSFEAYFRAVWRHYLDYLLAHPQAFLFMEQYAHSPFLEQNTKTKAQSLFQPLLERFEKAQREGLILKAPMELLLAFAHGPISALAKGHLSGALRLTPSLKAQASAAAWRAIRA